MIDLHAHSTFSDGSLTPEQLAEAGRRAGLTAVALTDHDSTDGLERFLAACRGAGITGVPGVEVSADVRRGTLHMLGYLIRPGAPALEDVLRKIREGRAARNQKILRRLNELGMALTWDEVAAYAGEDVVGRPHFAQAMVAKGYVADKDEAFNKYLAKGRAGYEDRFRLSPADSMAAIAGAGGLPILAHPFTLDLGQQALRDFVAELKGQGLEGIEVYYSEHSPDQVREYLSLARNLDLVATGGSDFHGAANPAIELGSGFGSLAVPDECLANLMRRRDARKA